MEKEQRSALVKSLATFVRRCVSTGLTTLSVRIDELEQRIARIPAGPKGEKGEPGDKGERGELGPSCPGARGEPGEPGPPGGPGPQGEPGDTGPVGPVGTKGDTGERGPQGEKGDSGKDGLPGEAGPVGPAGTKGDVGERGPQGEKGDSGKDGQSIKGDRGEPGEPGRDALQIDILPAIDETRSYPRGTYAMYAGGTIRSFRSTLPITSEGLEKAGWDVFADGQHTVEYEQSAEDPRSISIKTRMTSGREFIAKLFIPVPIYKKIFQHGNDYRKAEWVTFGGSGWECLVDHPKSAPGTNSAEWQLVIKRGEPGKDGAVGPQGPKGKDGRDGRDLTQVDFNGNKH